MRRTVAVMGKVPRLGLGKSRLAAEAGAVEALRINRVLHAHAYRVTADPRWERVLALTPERLMHAPLPGLDRSGSRIGQGPGDLGARLARLFARDWPGPLAVVGTDCPGATRAAIAAAFAGLRRAPFSIGPSGDGGFWIFAARRPRDAVAAFAGVRWSSPHALADLATRLPGRWATAPALDDVDTLADWRAFTRAHVRRGL